jgi:carboxyl-terminal processing protease
VDRPVRRRRRLSSLLLLLVLLPLVLVGGIWLGGHPDTLPGAVRETLVADSQGRLYDEAMGIIKRDYYRTVQDQRLLDQSLDAAVKSLDDRFSNYFSPLDYAHFTEVTGGAFEGVGMTVEQDPKGLRVISVYTGSPAARGGLKPGDVIVEVDGKSLAGTSSTEATARIKGPAGSTVTLTVRTPKRAERTVRLQRQRVSIPVVESSMKRASGRDVAYVRLASFTSGAHGQVKQAISRLLDRGAKGVVLDLRDNGGGLLDEAVLVSSIFLPDGKVVSTKGRSRPEHVYEATGGAIAKDVPVVVLVNGQTASASEIVTGALQDRHRAEVVGTRTFGKGVFQEVERLSNGGALDITVGEYFLPSGRNLGGGGVKRGSGIAPDVQAKDNPETPRRDEGLDAALKALPAAGA